MTKSKRKKVLLIDDDASYTKAVVRHLEERYDVVAADSAESGLSVFEKTNPDIVLLDIMLPGKDGIDCLKELKAKDPDLPVIMLTAIDRIPKAVESIKLGATNYFTKSTDDGHLHLSIERALSDYENKEELQQRRNLQLLGNREHRFIGESPDLTRIKQEIEVLGQSDCAVLIQGETGTGKELVARELHAQSLRASGPFVAINCAAIPKELIESELFGHKRGAFTGAQSEIGKFALANHGTLLFDEIGELSVQLQVKLLRVLEEREFYPVGSTELKQVDVRILASTNRDLARLIEKGTFREDLYYRLNVYTIEIPPLRERPQDIIPLVQFYLQQYNRKFDKNFEGISPDAREILLRSAWRGNVRELRNLIERIVLFEDESTITSDHLQFLRPPSLDKPGRTPSQLPEHGLDSELAEMEKKLLLKALEVCKWNKSKAARLLKLSRPAFDYRIEKHQID